MIRVRYRDSNELSPGLHAAAERHGRITTVYLLPGLTKPERRSALRRLRLSARMGHCPRLPSGQLALALFADRIRTGIGRAGAVLRLHPAGSTLPVMVLSGGAIAFLLFSTVSIRVMHSSPGSPESASALNPAAPVGAVPFAGSSGGVAGLGGSGGGPAVPPGLGGSSLATGPSLAGAAGGPGTGAAPGSAGNGTGAGGSGSSGSRRKRLRRRDHPQRRLGSHPGVVPGRRLVQRRLVRGRLVRGRVILLEFAVPAPPRRPPRRRSPRPARRSPRPAGSACMSDRWGSA